MTRTIVETSLRGIEQPRFIFICNKSEQLHHTGIWCRPSNLCLPTQASRLTLLAGAYRILHSSAHADPG